MKRVLLVGYQLAIGLSDALTGALLIIAPSLTLRLMFLGAPSDAQIYISFIGAFVLSVGLACLYGAFLAYRRHMAKKLEMVWLLTGVTRASVAIFVCVQVAVGGLEFGWLTVAVVDGACVVIQAIGLRRGWIANAAL